MKPLLLSCLLILVCASGVAQFEGMIKSRNRSVDYDGAAQEYEMTIWVKKSLVRITIPQIGEVPGSTAIYQTDNDISWILNDKDRTYFEVALPSLRDPRQKGRFEPTSADKPTITRTHQTRKMLGYLCEKVLIRKGDTETEVWGARGLSDLARVLSESLQPAEQGSGEDDVVAKMGLFPLRSVTRYEGRELESQEVTKIERKRLANELFQIPKGYKKQKALDVE
jgi:hypothetical protein